MALTDLQVRALKPTEKTYKVADGQGLCLEVTPAGESIGASATA